MKTRHFSMIEMLVVLVVISILAGGVMGGVFAAKQKANIVKTKGKMTSLRIAIEQYRGTYSVYPFTLGAGTSADVHVGVTPNTSYSDLIKTLRAGDSNLNPRRIKFLETGDDSYTDAWDSSLQVAIDLDYDGNIDGSFIFGAGNTDRELVIWSKGKDSSDSSTDTHATNEDNINSWDQN